MNFSNKLASILILFLLASPANAGGVLIRIKGVNHQIIYQQKVTARFKNAGLLTDAMLKTALRIQNIKEYQGSAAGVSSVNHLGSALEKISDTMMNAYGWCYHIDGVEPGVMPDKYFLTGKEKVIDWFYVYARMENGQWTEMCVPADHVPAGSTHSKF